jgi:hypothetical protein
MALNAARAFLSAAAAASIGAMSLPASALTVTTAGGIQFTSGDLALAAGATVLELPAPTSYNGGLALGANVGYTTSDGTAISLNGCCNYSGIYLPVYPGTAENYALGWTPMALNGQHLQTDYIQAEGTNAATITFSRQESYLGLAWGSPDPGDTFSFYNGSALVGTVTVAQIVGQAGELSVADPVNADYTVYVNFDATSGQTFNSVVLSDPRVYADQVGDIVYSQQAVTLTDAGIAAGADQIPLPPLAGSVPGILALLGFLGLRRRMAGHLSPRGRAVHQWMGGRRLPWKTRTARCLPHKVAAQGHD